MAFRIQNLLPTGPRWDLYLSVLNARKRLGYWPNTANPQTFNEIILAQKERFGGDIDLARRITDKHLFKLWLNEIDLPELVVHTLDVLETEAELRAYEIAQDVIVKPTHSSGDLMVRPASTGAKFSKDEIQTMREWLQSDYYLRSREPNYLGLEPRIIVEEMLIDQQGNLPEDYKIFCASGRPFMIQMDIDRFADHTRQLYTPDWELLPYCMCYPRHDVLQPRPPSLNRALELASVVSKYFNFARVDFYILSDTDLKLGEITFFPGNGAEVFTPAEGDLLAGQRYTGKTR